MLNEYTLFGALIFSILTLVAHLSYEDDGLLGRYCSKHYGKFRVEAIHATLRFMEACVVIVAFMMMTFAFGM